MKSVHYFTRVTQIRISEITSKLTQKVCWNSNSSSSNSSDEMKVTKKLKNGSSQNKNEKTLSKLNNLLKAMIEEDTIASKLKLELSKPSSKRKSGMKKEENESVDTKLSEKRMVQAIKNVAKAIEGDAKQTESELLIKLLGTSENKSVTSTLVDLIKGMKIDHEPSSHQEQSRAQQVKQILEHVQQTKSSNRQKLLISTRPRSDVPLEKINMFGSEPLGIYNDLLQDATEGVQNKTWSKLHKRDLKLAVIHPPSNYFQQLILWTEQEKVWKFPIDNEQGLEEEKSIYFTEHVFLEKHLEPWCPPKGPLRHFMELVCVGLSKNPYLTVEAKKEHICWFQKYFENKKQLLREVGALQDFKSEATI